MASARDLYAEWKRCAPNDAALEDVRKVVLHFFGEENTGGSSTGSHLIIISGEVMRWACQFRDQGYGELAWLRGDCMSIPAHKGRSVKRVYVEHLIKLIDFWGTLQQQLKKGR